MAATSFVHPNALCETENLGEKTRVKMPGLPCDALSMRAASIGVRVSETNSDTPTATLTVTPN